MIRFFAALALVTSALFANAQQAPWVKINGHDAHPSRVLVKLKANPAKAAPAQPEYKIDKSFSHLPGLAVVSMIDQAGLKAAVGGDDAAALQETIRRLEATGQFEYVEPDYINRLFLTPTDAAFIDGRLWGLRNLGLGGGVAGADINAVPAWDISIGNRSVVVAVIDSGINYDHVDLAPNMWRNPGEIAGNNVDDDQNGYIDDVFGINAIADNGDPNDDNGHGSHVAGTIGAAGNNAGAAVGVIWEVQLMALKAFDADGFGGTADEIECINYAVSKRAPISNNSWGGFGRSQALYDAIAASRAQGHLFVAAAGNDDNDNDETPAFPASFDLDNIIAVAALDRADRLAGFSNYGATTVDVGAPGVEIFSAWMGSPTAYATIQGTSMASPHVAGAAALLLSAEPTADYTRLRDKLLQKVVVIPSLVGKTVTGGRINLFESIRGQADGILELSINPASNSYFATNSVTNILVRVTDDFNVNDATVTGRFAGQNLTFVNGTAPDTNPTDGIYTATVTMPRNPGFYDITISATAPNKQPATLTATYEVLPLPANDNFANARKIRSEGETVEGDNRLASSEVGEPLHAGVSNFRSLWWSWSHPTATRVLMDTAGTTFDDSAVLAVYTGPNITNLTEVVSALPTANGPNGTRAPFVDFTATAGATYWIAVAQSGISTNSPGQVSLRVEPNGQIDTTRPVVAITNIISGSFIRSLNSRTNIAGIVEDPRPNASGVAEVHMRVNDNQLFTRIFLATNYTTFTNWSSPDFDLRPGWNTIEVKAFDRADNESQIVTVEINYLPEAGGGNDLLAYARQLPSSGGNLAGSDIANNELATKEFGEPFHAGNEGGRSVWWYFVAPSDGTIFLTTAGSDFDTLLALYHQPNVNDRSVRNLTLVMSNDDADPVNNVSTSELSAAVRAGQLYYIAVDGYGGAFGNVRLDYALSGGAVFRVTTSVSPTAGGGTITPGPGTTAFPVNSAVEVRAIPERYRQFRQFIVSRGGVQSIILENPYTFILTEDVNVVAEFEPKQFTDDFETGGFSRLPYRNVANGWEVRSTTGPSGGQTLAARAVGVTHLTTNSLVLVTNLAATVGSFDYRVSSEAGFDWFEFLVNGQVVLRRSGEVPWTTFSFGIPAIQGPTTLEWRYVKDAALSRGEDTVWIDNLDLPVVAGNTQQPTVTATLNETGQFQLFINNPSAPNQSYEVQRATTLASDPTQTIWEPVGVVTANTSGRATYTETNPSPTRAFYRVINN